MGRHYFGQISGKFWFGFQNSDDASCFGVDCKPVRNFYVCCCELLQPPARCAVTTEFNHSPNSVVALRSEESSKIGEDSDDLTKEIYCTDCYSSYEEHCQAMIDEDIELYDEDDVDSTWYTSDSEVTYHFDASHIDIVEKNIKIMEDLIGDYVNDNPSTMSTDYSQETSACKQAYVSFHSNYKIIDDADEITYDYTTPSNISAFDIELIARLCLGKQILYCLRKNGECFFTAELQ
jgi:hypothetical protein